MKKILALTLACLLLVCCFSACASQPAQPAQPGAPKEQEKSNEAPAPAASGKKTLVTFWTHQEDGWDESYDNMAELFMAENPDVDIQIERFPYDQFESKIMTSLSTKSGGADLYEIWGGWGIDFASTGALAAMPGEVQSMLESEYYKPTIGALQYDGKIYGFPLEFNIECGGMLVNNKILQENGLEIPRTWNDLLAAAKKAVVMDGKLMTIKGFDFANPDGVAYLLTSMILSQGSDYQDSSGAFTFNTAEGQKALDELKSLIAPNANAVTDMEGLTGGDDMEGYMQLYADRVLFVPRGPWVISVGVSSFDIVYGDQIQYVACPWYGGKQAFAAETGWSLAVNGNSTVKDAAFRFIEFISKDEILLQHNIACAQIPAKISVAQTPELIEKMPYAAPLVPVLDKAKFIGHFNTDIFKDTLNEMFIGYVNGDYASAEQALSGLDAQLTEKCG